MEAIHNFRVAFIDDVLVKLLWHDYTSSGNQDVVLIENSKDPPESSSQLAQKRAMEKQRTKYPNGYVLDLGRCIIQILSGIYSVNHELLSAFCATFQENCLEIVKQTENIENRENAEQVIKFLLLLRECTVLEGENWPLVHLVGPMLSTSFPLIRSLVSCYNLLLQF